MRLASITSTARLPKGGLGFTLIEVIVALGLLTVSVVAMVVLSGSMHHSIAELSDRERAASLADGIEIELRQMRDAPGQDGQLGGLDRLASLLPASDDTLALRMVASHDGSRVLSESAADESGSNLPARDRHFLIELRQQSAPLAYRSGAGFLAATAAVRWPYRPESRALGDDSQSSPPVPGSTLALNFAVTP